MFNQNFGTLPAETSDLLRLLLNPWISKQEAEQRGLGATRSGQLVRWEGLADEAGLGSGSGDSAGTLRKGRASPFQQKGPF